MAGATVIHKAVYDNQGVLVGHMIDTYSPVAAPAPTPRSAQRPQPMSTPPACACACHQQDDLATFDEEWLPSDSPDWGNPTPRRLTTQASDEDADLPDDAPTW